MGHISAKHRYKRPQEGPTSGGGSGSGATLRHTYDMIDSETLQGTENDVLHVDNVSVLQGISIYFENHHIAFYFLYSTVWQRLRASCSVLEASWSVLE
jgi:hypothetical protein